MTNQNLELITEYFIIPLFFCIVSVILYVRYTYSYTCQSCGSYISRSNKVIKCRFCSMQLCRRCRTKGFCPKCFGSLTKEQQKKISRPYIFYPVSLLLVFLSVVLIVTVSILNGDSSFIAGAIVFFIIYICVGAFIFKSWLDSAKKNVIDERLRDSTRISSFGRTSVDPKEIVAILSDKIKRCVKCGRILEKDIKFCPDCGTQN